MAGPHPLLIPLITGSSIIPDATIDPAVVESAREHGVAALVDRAVTAGELDATSEARELLAMASLEVAAEHAAALTTTRIVQEAADDLGIDIAFFKGITIAALHYEVPDTRPTIDVDVFVAPHHAHRTGELASALGVSDPEAATIDAMVAEGRVFEHSIATDAATIDLHRDPMNMVVNTVREVDRWSHTISVALPDGREVRTLDLEDRIIQALLHLFRDNFADLLHLNDVRLMAAVGPDWGVIERRSAIDGWTDLVRFAMWFVTDTFGSPSPLPTRIQRWRKLMIDAVWPESLLLDGAGSVVRSNRRQSALSLLGHSRRSELLAAYRARVLPPRSVIALRSGRADGPYATTLIRWRAAQRRDLRAERRAAS